MGTFAVRDYVIDGNGHLWVCTVAGSPGTWVSRGVEAANRLTAQEGQGNHYWTASGSCASNTEPFITGWSAQRNAGIATVDANGFVRLNRAGRWFVSLSMTSDAAVNGITQARINWPSAPFAPLNDILQSDHRQSGYPGCGYSWVTIPWSGWVSAAEAANPFRCLVYQSNATGVAVSYTYYLQVNYLGGAA
jgi:hypothetical protein